MDAIASVSDATVLHFEGLQGAAERAAQRLARAGVPEGALVALMLPNSLDFVPTYLALRKLSATVALISPKFGAAELDAIRRELRPRCFVTTTGVAFEPDGDPPPALPPDTALLKFTSGSTGQPKGIALSAANLDAEADNIVSGLGLGPGDRILAPVPLTHSYGFDLGVLAMLRARCTLALEDVFVPRRILAELASGRTSVFLGVPAMYRAWLGMPPGSDPALPVRYLLSCTAPLPASVVTAFHARYRAAICQHYGSSETGAVTTHVPQDVLARPDSVGSAMGDVALRVVDREGRAVPDGADGEVVVTSGAVAHGGYVMGAPTDRRDPFRPAGYHTGDLGSVKDGFLYVRGRVDDLINVGGFKVAPREVIEALESHPAVTEAAVIGVKDPRGEEVVYAVVALSRSATEAELAAHCRTRLAEYKVPRRIDIRPSLPRGATGKVQLRAEDVHL